MSPSFPKVPDFSPDLIALAAPISTKAAAIDAVADLLVRTKAIDPAYIPSMHAREAQANTYLGEGVAIPHGQPQARQHVLHDCIAVLQIPQGVDWGNGNTVHLVFGIAARGDGHLDVLRRITRLLQDKSQLALLRTTTNKQDIVRALSNAETPATAKTAQDLPEQHTWVMDYPGGLHARPASAWLQAAQSPAPHTRTQVRNTRNGHSSGFASLVELLGLDARCGDSLVFSADGEHAKPHLQQLMAQVTALSASEKATADNNATPPPADAWQPPEGGQNPLRGVPASPGLALGVIVRVQTTASTPPDIADQPEPLPQAAQRLQAAIAAAQAQIKALTDDITRRAGSQDAAIFGAHAQLLHDEPLLTAAGRYLAQGHGLAWAWHRAYTEAAACMQAQDNAMLAARAADIHDVGRRVLSHIAPELVPSTLEDRITAAFARLPDSNTKLIVLADDLSPSDTARLDVTRVAALATSQGGPYGHTAILARTLGLPAVVALGDAALQQVEDGTQAIVDGSAGNLWLAPSSANQQAATAHMHAAEQLRQQQARQRQLPAVLLGGTQIDIAANINHPEQTAQALDCGAEGVGLMRTEFLFLERAATPTEEEQHATYCAMLDALQGHPLIVRALDIGGDKQVPHLHLPHEDNPFLGVRGARLLLQRPDLLHPQLHALYRTAKNRPEARLSLMFPMISTLEEVQHLWRVAEDIRLAVDAPKIPLGIMVEVPAAALLARQLAAHVDFFSIGTNDLTQYTLAMDRQNPRLAAAADSLHPAVLHMVHATVQGAKAHGRWVGVCGGLAGSPFGAGLLTGLGVQELSMTPREIPAVKDWLRAQRLSDLQALAQHALTLETAAQVKALEQR